MNLLRLWWNFLRIGVLNEFQYRVNFFIQILQSFIALGTGLIGLALVFDHTETLAGWTRPELLAVMGVHILMGGVIRSSVQPNMQRLMDDVREGTLDFALTKPADSQAMVSIREFRLWQLVDVVMGLIILFYAVGQMTTQLGVIQSLAFLIALVLGGIMIYCFWLMVTSSAFWIVRVHEIANLFEGLYAAGRWPVGVYPDWLRTGLTFIVPVAFAVTVPVEALTNRLSTQTLLGAVGLTILLFLLARLIWKTGLKNYSGASA